MHISIHGLRHQLVSQRERQPGQSPVDGSRGAHFYTPPGAAVEGYGLCVNNTLKAYDHACSGSGFGPPTVIAAQTATGMTIRRKSTDGLFPLDQKWSRDNTEHDLTEQMTLKILGPAASSVVLWRLADINVDFTDGADNATGLYDRLDRSNYSIWFRDQVNEWDVVRMSVLTPGTPHGVHVSASTIPESAPASVRFHIPAGVRTPWVQSGMGSRRRRAVPRRW